MIKGIAHLCIRVADLGRTARFYCQGLGLEKAFDFRRDDKTVGFYLKAGNGNYLEFFEREPAEPARIRSTISVSRSIRSTASTPPSSPPATRRARKKWAPTTPIRPG